MTLPVRLAVAHAHFEAVHPFPDGSGRVGRSLWPLQMAASGVMPVYLSGYIEKEKDLYAKSLQSAQKKLRYAPLIELLSDAIVASKNEMARTKSLLQALPAEWEKRAAPRKNSAAARALPLLVKLPIISANQLTAELSCSFTAASNALSQLTAAGVVRERTSFQRNRIFAAEEVIHLLSREFGADPKAALAGARRLLQRSSQAGQTPSS